LHIFDFIYLKFLALSIECTTCWGG